MCISTLSYPALKNHAQYNIVMCGLSACAVFIRYFINGTIFGKKKILLNIKCVFLFYLQLSSETFFMLRRINLLTPNDHYRGRTAPLTSKRCILYIYSTNIGTEYFKHGIYSPFFPLQNAVCFTMLTYLVPVLSTFYIQDVLKLNK